MIHFNIDKTCELFVNKEHFLIIYYSTWNTKIIWFQEAKCIHRLYDFIINFIK